MRWKDLFLNDFCIICGEPTSYYVCNKCRDAVMQVRERMFPDEKEEIDASKFITGFFPSKKKRRNKKHANST